jgi:hypothetical protein
VGLGQEELQPLHRRILRTDHRLSAHEGGQRLVPFPGQQQPGQILAEPPPLSQGGEQPVEAGRVLLQRPRSRRAGTTRSHHNPQMQTQISILKQNYPKPTSTNHRYVLLVLVVFRFGGSISG